MGSVTSDSHMLNSFQFHTSWTVDVCIDIRPKFSKLELPALHTFCFTLFPIRTVAPLYKISNPPPVISLLLNQEVSGGGNSLYC